MTKLIIFDMDGVLIDSESIIAEVMSETLKGLGVDLSPAQVHARFVGRSTLDSMADLTAMTDKATVDEFVRRAQPVYARRLNEELEPAPGVEAALGLVDQAGLVKCVASNSQQPHIRTSLHKTGLLGRFDSEHLFSGCDMPRPKPAPDLHQHCLAQFGLAPQDALVIEDSLTGLQGAIAAGIPVWGMVAVHPEAENQTQALLAAGAERVLQSWEEFEL